MTLIRHFERRALLRPSLPAIIKTGGRNVRVSEHGLDFNDIGVMIEGSGRGGFAQGMRRDEV